MFDAAVPSSLHSYLQSAIRSAVPFLQSGPGPLLLIAPAAGRSQREHEQVLCTLQEAGVLTFYRYIDSKPQPAILAVRA
jgi:hypothetical protein